MEADRVHQLVQNDADHETGRVERNDLWSPDASDEAAAPAHFKISFELNALIVDYGPNQIEPKNKLDLTLQPLHRARSK